MFRLYDWVAGLHLTQTSDRNHGLDSCREEARSVRRRYKGFCNDHGNRERCGTDEPNKQNTTPSTIPTDLIFDAIWLVSCDAAVNALAVWAAFELCAPREEI
jgi:hypothetical protein